MLSLTSFSRTMVVTSRICNECPVAGETYSGRYGVIAGWGLTGNGTVVPDVLLSATVQILENTVCSQLWNSNGYAIHDSQLCTGLGNAASCGVRQCFILCPVLIAG